ncbi:MAG TPA: fibronectin type III domain-containing protein [Thermoanaerobaculia bacterium]|nr:fibronectin type III domain-containing protein [Thermoanaerobaculia bacterium]
MAKRSSLLLMILLLASMALPAAATTVVVGTDEDLFDHAPLVLEGTVLGSSPAHGRPATEYQVRVDRTLKGRFTQGTVVVRVIGGEAANGMHLTIWGAPSLKAGEKTLLFLAPEPGGGAYHPLHLALGAFHEVQGPAGQTVAIRDLRDMQDVGSGEAKQAVDTARDAGRFTSWLADRAAGLKRPADYLISLPAGGLESLQEKFTYLGGVKQRWPDFDANKAVGWRSQESGQPGLADGGVSEFMNALAAWDNDPDTNIRYRYDGTTTSTSGFQNPDGINAIIFNDPNNEVPDSFTCSSPGRGEGVLAIGGTWSGPGANGVETISEGDIITNDGVGCWFSTPKRAEQVFGHELGHTLGLGHSCGDTASGTCVFGSLQADALMRATAFADERGARLNDDDRAGILSLYAGSSTPPSTAPAAPTGLAATAASPTSIQLTWTDNANNETLYRVEMKTGTGKFAVVKNLAANTASVTIDGLKAQTAYSFRVQARNGNVASAYSNVASATTPSSAQPPAAPSSLTATPLSDTSIRLDWKDNASNETGFVVTGSSPDGALAAVTSVPANAQSFTVTGLAPTTPYTFEVTAQNATGSSAASNEASATTLGLAAGPCVAGAQTLCLQGQFRVTVRWRANGTSGGGQVLNGSGTTGMFWFFDASNVELIVKMIDGRGLNGFFWTFYGGLSDQEYWITVTDTQTGTSRTYHNDSGNLCGLGDVNAFAASGSAATAGSAVLGGGSASAAACVPGSLCLAGGRFQATVSWHTPDGKTGAGTAVPLTDVSGLFWFFDATNIELVVKVIDARPVNGKFWIFYGALSDVQYDLTVTDTSTGSSHTYHNNQGNLCGQADTSTFSG